MQKELYDKLTQLDRIEYEVRSQSNDLTEFIWLIMIAGFVSTGILFNAFLNLFPYVGEVLTMSEFLRIPFGITLIAIITIVAMVLCAIVGYIYLIKLEKEFTIRALENSIKKRDKK